MVLIKSQDGYIEEFNKQRIIDALMRDAKFLAANNGKLNIIDEEEIRKVATKVSYQIESMNFDEKDIVSSDTIRGLVVTELRKMDEHELADIVEIVGIKTVDLIEVWQGKAYADNANINGKTPEAQHKYIADSVAKKGALKLLPEDVVQAHLTGRIHVHDLDYFANRPFCNEHDLRYYFYYGLYADGTGDSIPVASPAKTASVAVLHAAKALGSAQGNFAGGQGYQNFLTFLAPYLEGMNYEEIRQLMQMYIYEMSQMMNARGGQAVFSTTQLTPGVPDIFKNVPVVKAGKIYDGKQAPLRTYGEFEREVRLGFKAYTEVMLHGDAFGRPFSFPKYEVEVLPEHWDYETWNDKMHTMNYGICIENVPSYKELWYDMCRLIAKDGTPYIHNALDTTKGSIKCYSCCAFTFSSSAKADPDFDDKLHFRDGKHFILGSLQVGTINLPQAAYASDGNMSKFMDHCRESIQLLIKMFLVKKTCLSKQNLPFARQTPIDPNDSAKRAPPLWSEDGLPYCIGIVGLNEAVQVLVGDQIHESSEAHKKAIEILVRLQSAVNEAAQKSGLKIAFARTPAETTSQRFAVCDLLNGYKDRTSEVVKGDLKTALEKIDDTKDLPIYYTNGAMCVDGADISVFEKIRLEEHAFSAFDGGNIFHFWLGEESPDPSGLLDLIDKILHNSNIKYFAFTKDYSLCQNCHNMMAGLREICEKCDSDDVTQFSRITGYIQAVKGKKVSGWNAAKKEELKNRTRYRKL